MSIDLKYLREHYASLSDEALQAINRADLVAEAQRCYDDEVRQRKDTRLIADLHDLAHQKANVEFEARPAEDLHQPGWREDAAEVFSRVDRLGTPPGAEIDAREALEAAGIPCYVERSEIPKEESSPAFLPPTHVWRVLVPGDLNLRAASVLDRDIFNQQYEDDWKTLLETFSDEEVREMKPEVVFCGLFDRVERVIRAYDEELARRKL